MEHETLVQKRDEYAKLLRESVQQIVAKLSRLNNVEKVSLFGSYTRGRADLFTDLDILVIMRTEKPFLERIKEIYSLLALPVDVDILCYTPEEFNRLKGSPFFSKVLREEVVLYEKKSD